MKYLMILTVGVCLLFVSVPVIADQAEDEAAIRKVEEQINAAFNKHDAKAMFSLINHVDNCENWDGSRKGRAAVEKYYSELFEQQKDIKTRLLDEIGIIFVTPDVAVIKARYETTGMVGEDGKPLPPEKTLEADVLVRKNGRWLSAAFFDRPIEQ